MEKRHPIWLWIAATPVIFLVAALDSGNLGHVLDDVLEGLWLLSPVVAFIVLVIFTMRTVGRWFMASRKN
jgi:hypothetical protein